MDRLVRFNDLRSYGIPWTRTYIAELERKGQFPKRVRLAARTMGWWEADIRAFVAATVRDQKPTMEAA